jgi:hypothetical protein
MSKRTLVLESAAEYDAVIAALRLLATALNSRPEVADIVTDILTNGGAHAGLSSEQVHDIADRFQAD